MPASMPSAGLQLRDDFGQCKRRRDGADRLHRLDLQGRGERPHFLALDVFQLWSRCLQQDYGRRVVDRADHAQALVEEHGLEMIAIGRVLDRRILMLRRAEQAGHLENLETRIEIGHE
jgi:hypothetical protein